ncbi:lymphocyte antigen 86 [Callospermophilus lateralis]|uniref:lymphocyte antigen 86 n=1 Tax=Callospermophilus lateralis TaxID=76772 RepID=UPI00403858C7
MNGLTAALLVWTLISPSGGGHRGGGEIWPTHVACRNEGLEVFYQSCDSLQDFGFSVDQCSKKLQPHLSIRFGIILREDIRELFLDVLLLTKGASVLSLSYPICEDDLPKFSFCGRRKGEQVYYAGPVDNSSFDVPEGEYQVLLKLYNENRSTVACANVTVIAS